MNEEHKGMYYVGYNSADGIDEQSPWVPFSELEKDVKELQEKKNAISTEQELADVFARVSDAFWWDVGELDEYESGSEEFRILNSAVDTWIAMMEELKERIFAAIRRDQDEDEPDIDESAPYLYTILPFMEKHGYRNCGGWWFALTDEET